MLFKTQIANMKIDGNSITVSAKNLNFSFDYDSLDYLSIVEEINETAREMELSVLKIKRTQARLAELLRVNFDISGVSFCFTVPRDDGDALAKRVEDEHRRFLLEDSVIAKFNDEEFRKKILEEDPDKIEYPVIVRKCNFDYDGDTEADAK